MLSVLSIIFPAAELQYIINLESLKIHQCFLTMKGIGYIYLQVFIHLQGKGEQRLGGILLFQIHLFCRI